ncbi:hypothetical protein P67b_00020 [Ruegeria phage Tedan]|nr:hypothetical protein P67b_00020 [Ruegeria phage Tedan]
MSKTKENRLWQWLREARKLYREDLILERIENSLMGGMADVNGSLQGRDFWLELKTAAWPSTPGGKVQVKFQPNQPRWLGRRSKIGRNAFVLLQVGSGHKACRYLLDGIYAAKIEKGLTEGELERLALLDPRSKAADIIQAARSSY